MASIIRIKRSETAGNPSKLAAGELAYSALPDNGSNGGERLYIGIGSETAGDASNHYVIGGKYFTDKLDHTPGTLTANSAIIVDGDKKIDHIYVSNLHLTDNTITSTNTNGNIALTPDGTGHVQISGAYTLPRVDGSSGYVLTANGDGTSSWTAPASSSFTLAGDSGTDTFNTGETLTIEGSGPVSTAVTDNTVTISVGDATTSDKGIASFGSSDFSVTTGAVSLVGAVVKSIGTQSGSITPTTNSFNIDGTGAISTSADGDTVVIAVDTATTSVKGVASFDSATFDVTAGEVSIKSNGVSNSQLANSSITIGTTEVSLGGTSLTLAGLDQIDVDNIRINGNEISSTDTDGNISLNPNGTGTVDVNSSRITGVAEPQNDSDAATKYYVDNRITGLSWKQAVHVLADSNVPLTGSTPLVIDGHTVIDGNRILLTNQSTATQNGIYVAAVPGNGTYTLSRASDADVYTELNGAAVFVEQGTTYAKTGWVQGTPLTSFASQTWVQFSGAGTYSAGDGLTLLGSQFSVKLAYSGLTNVSGLSFTSGALELSHDSAGNGLTIADGVYAVGGTSDRITINSDSIDIADTYVGQTSITTLGTVTTGTWHGDAIGPTYGGTGLTGYTKGDLLYSDATNSLAALGIGSLGKVLQVNASGLPVWGDLDGGTY